jgi:hypothetical protein
VVRGNILLVENTGLPHDKNRAAVWSSNKKQFRMDCFLLVTNFEIFKSIPKDLSAEVE